MLHPKTEKITIRVYRPGAGFVTIALPDGTAPLVGSEVEIAGSMWKVTMVEYPVQGRRKTPPDGLTRHSDGTNVLATDDERTARGSQAPEDHRQLDGDG